MTTAEDTFDSGDWGIMIMTAGHGWNSISNLVRLILASEK